ncbi:transposase [Salmonella enterica]|nr:transposase [Salmonella enterica]
MRDDRNADHQNHLWFGIVYSPDWGGKHTHNHLCHLHGVLQCDGYAGYEKLFSAERKGGPLTEAVCMAHARRGINDVWEPTRTSATAEEALSRIGDLYAIEKEIRGFPEAERLRIRQSRSKPSSDGVV